MVHILGEWFGMPLVQGVLWQRLLISIFAQELRKQVLGLHLEQTGNDLYVIGSGIKKKLSVSIVTATPVSVVFHLGVNIDPTGAPVVAVGLGTFGVDAVQLTKNFLKRAEAEWQHVAWACAKVRPVM